MISVDSGMGKLYSIGNRHIMSEPPLVDYAVRPKAIMQTEYTLVGRHLTEHAKKGFNK